MATPIISTLRRNQGYVLAVMGVVLIITWVIGPAALDFMSGGGGGGGRGNAGRNTRERPVVQWTKGSTTKTLTEADIEQLRQEHRAVLEFVNSVVRTAVDKERIPRAPGLNLTPDQRTGQIQLGLPMDTSEATVVNILLFAERGQELGVRVDKEAMVSYLKNLSGFSLEEGNFVELAQKTVSEATKSNQLLSVDSLFAALRKELVCQQTQYMLGTSASNVSTGELWDFHKQLNLRYKIEAYPVDVEKLKGNFKAADAKQEELLALFEKGKDRVPNPDFPEPGFRIPHRIAFCYCTVDFEPFLQQAKKNVPEAKAVETYKTGVNQGRFRKVTLPGLPGEIKPGETKPAETKPGETKPGEEKTPPAEPEKKEPPQAEETKPAEEEAVEKPAEKAKEEPAKPAQEKPAEDKPEQVAVVCDEDPDKASKPDEAKPADEKKADEKPAEEKAPAKEEPTTEPAKPDTTPPAAEKPAGEKTEDPAKTEPKAEEVKHKTYQEARDEILTELAQPEAVILRDEAIRNAMDELRIYSTKLKRYHESKQAAAASAQVTVENPGDFHPVAFAGKYKFRAGKTNLMDRHEVQETDLGRSAVLRGQRGSLSFSQFAYFERANLYDPRDVDSAFGDTRYIYWRIADEPEQEVALEKDGSLPPAVKEKVEDAWLKEKAYEAAKKKAEELASKAKGTSLKDLVGKTEAIKVVEPFPFSMYTTDGLPLMFGGQPEFSRPNGVPLAGKEFMDAVFSLKPGEAGIAPDQPHKVVYAVRVLGDEPSLEIRREMFLSALQRGRMSDLMAFASMEHGREAQGLFDDLEKHFNVKWMRAINTGDGGE